MSFRKQLVFYFATESKWSSIILFTLGCLELSVYGIGIIADMDIVFWLQVWAANTAGQLEMSFSHPEEDNPADSRSVSVYKSCLKHWRIDLVTYVSFVMIASLLLILPGLVSKIMVLTRDCGTLQASLPGALKMCGCPDQAGKPVLLCSYNDNTVRLYDLPTYVPSFLCKLAMYVPLFLVNHHVLGSWPYVWWMVLETLYLEQVQCFFCIN